MPKIKKIPYKKLAFLLSFCAIILWAVLGAGTSLAWFTDSDDPVKNVFHFAEFDLDVSYRTEEGEWKPMEGATEIFDDKALYEPGYVQVVYLKIDNKGEVPFDFQTAVTVTDYTLATNLFGNQFNLQDYLRFGLVTADSEQAMDLLVESRDRAKMYADEKLNNYETDVAELDAGATKYMALVVRMPDVIGNEANYRGDDQPKVELGIIVNATQKK